MLSDDPTAVDSETLADLEVLVTVKEEEVVYRAEAETEHGALGQAPFAGDPIFAHLFLHAMYRGLGVETPCGKALSARGCPVFR